MTIILFNLVDYGWVMNWIEQKGGKKSGARLCENDYDESNLLEIKVPLDLLYHTNWKDSERCDGAVEFDNLDYKYVKRKIEAGCLMLKCIPNESRLQFTIAREYLFQLVNELQWSKPGNKSTSSLPTVQKTSLGDYDEQLPLDFSYLEMIAKSIFSLIQLTFYLTILSSV